jgi:gliding motility-associated-like protein
MGRSADTVFIATNSTNVIEYAAGTLKLIGTADGIPDTVNSIGINLGWNLDDDNTKGKMLFCTKHGIRTFDVNSQTLGFLPDTGAYVTNSKVAKSYMYESTYRTENYKDSVAGEATLIPDSVFSYTPFVFYSALPYAGYSTINASYFWEDNKTFGLNALTVLALNDASSNNNDGVFATTFWGSQNGMFQTISNYSYNTAVTSWKQYLNGIRVNKITDIFGLTSFTTDWDRPWIRQNLLIGTSAGLYFSSSVYNDAGFYVPAFSLFKDPNMANTVINDICVNAVPDAQPICENGVWLGAADGLYLLAPDYGAFFNNQQQSFISFQGQPDTLSNLEVCSVSPVTASTQSTYTNIQWYKDGAELTGQTQNSLSITAAGDYNAVIYDPCEGLHIESNHLKVTAISGPVFAFNYPPVISMCAGSSDTLQVTYNASYHYQWYTNGVLNGDTTSTLVVTQPGTYYVGVSACTNSWVPSSKVQVNVITLPTPQITSENNPNCAGDTATLSTGFPADSPYTYKWYLNGGLVTTGNGLPALKTLTAGNYTVTITSTIDTACSQTSAVYQLSFIPAPAFGSQFPAQYTTCGSVTLEVQPESGEKIVYRWYTNNQLNGDTTNTFEATQSGGYRVEISSCQGAWVSSNTIQLTIINLPTPAITANQQSYCAGQDAVLTESVPVDPSYSITWYNNGAALPANNNKTSITTNVGGNYTVIVSSVEDSGEGTPCTETSSVLALTFNPLPTLSIAEQNNASLCIGQKVTLTAQYSGGSLAWTTGETSNSITVTQSGIYGATVTSASGCSKDTSITLTFSPAPVLNLSDTAMCAYTQGPIMLTAPAGFVSYKWNGVSGSQTYTVTQPGIITLIVTDANGCEATQQIKVADNCTAVHIPNTITPNGDGVNDTWVIDGLDETATVKVFTRWGMQVYNSVGYGSPWHGEYGGKKLPQGVYYYVITAKNNSQTLSGWLTIIY